MTKTNLSVHIYPSAALIKILSNRVLENSKPLGQTKSEMARLALKELMKINHLEVDLLQFEMDELLLAFSSKLYPNKRLSIWVDLGQPNLRGRVLKA